MVASSAAFLSSVSNSFTHTTQLERNSGFHRQTAVVASFMSLIASLQCRLQDTLRPGAAQQALIQAWSPLLHSGSSSPSSRAPFPSLEACWDLHSCLRYHNNDAYTLPASRLWRWKEPDRQTEVCPQNRLPNTSTDTPARTASSGSPRPNSPMVVTCEQSSERVVSASG